MATLQIRKKTSIVWEHVSSLRPNRILSQLYCKTDGDYFRFVEPRGTESGRYKYNEITIYDETSGGSAETFASARALMVRLSELEYTGFLQGSGGGGGGVTEFTELDDTPSSYSGQGGKVVAVKDDESGIEFITGGGGGTTQTLEQVLAVRDRTLGLPGSSTVIDLPDTILTVPTPDYTKLYDLYRDVWNEETSILRVNPFNPDFVRNNLEIKCWNNNENHKFEIQAGPNAVLYPENVILEPYEIACIKHIKTEEGIFHYSVTKQVHSEIDPTQRISTTVKCAPNGDTGIPEYHVDLLADYNKFIYDYEIEGSYPEYHIILPSTAPEDFVFDKEYHFAPKGRGGATTNVIIDAGGLTIPYEIKYNEVLIARPLYVDEFGDVFYNISKRILEIPQPDIAPYVLLEFSSDNIETTINVIKDTFSTMIGLAYWEVEHNSEGNFNLSLNTGLSYVDFSAYTLLDHGSPRLSSPSGLVIPIAKINELDSTEIKVSNTPAYQDGDIAVVGSGLIKIEFFTNLLMP